MSAAEGLEGLVQLLAAEQWIDRRRLAAARRRAGACLDTLMALEHHERGREQLQAHDELALLRAAAELFAALRSELAAAPEQAATLIERIDESTPVTRMALAREVLRAPELLGMVPAQAIAAQMAMACAFARLRSASVWVLDESGQARALQHVGSGAPSRAVKALARELLAGEERSADEAKGLLIGMRVGDKRHPTAVVIGSPRQGAREASAWVLAEALPVLAAILERDSLLAGNAAAERALVESSQRKLTRLGFDLHDGPIQEVALLGGGLRQLGEQLETIVDSQASRTQVRGRMRDLNAQMLDLDTALRRISNEVRSGSVLLDRPFDVALADAVRAFQVRTGIEPRLLIEGDMGVLSDSQQIALLNIIGEALTNIREHSGASEVRIDLNADSKIEARVYDNGCGFELEPTLMRAARKGRLGIVAMHERVRLLGGRCRIDSRPGGPTVVEVTLEPWRPLEPA